MLQDVMSIYTRYPEKKLRILVTGSHGLVGTALVPFLQEGGHEVVCLQRGKQWDPSIGHANISYFENFDAVIHLAGENIASRWTKSKKEKIFLSRCRDTWLLSHVLTRVSSPPKVVISASACGIYGNRGEEILTEGSEPGSGFLADVCVKWEKATDALEDKGIRVVHPRFGVILSKKGGMLPKIIKPMKLGLGIIFGSGHQIMSWVALDDVIASLYHILMKEDIHGPVNVTSPSPITQEELFKKVADTVGGKIAFKMPIWMTKWLFGEMAEEMLLTSQKVLPHRLLHSGYSFICPEIDSALTLSRS